MLMTLDEMVRQGHAAYPQTIDQNVRDYWANHRAPLSTSLLDDPYALQKTMDQHERERQATQAMQQAHANAYHQAVQQQQQNYLQQAMLKPRDGEQTMQFAQADDLMQGGTGVYRDPFNGHVIPSWFQRREEPMGQFDQ